MQYWYASTREIKLASSLELLEAVKSLSVVWAVGPNSIVDGILHHKSA